MGLYGLSGIRLTDDAAKAVVPSASVDEAAGLIWVPGFDSLLVRDGFLFVLERPVIKALLNCLIRWHDPPTEVVAITDGTAL